MKNKFTRYIAAGASALAAFFIAVISFLSSRLKSEKKKAADNAAKAKSYETQMEKLESVQEEIRTIEEKKGPESVPAPVNSDERLERLNRLSDRK